MSRSDHSIRIDPVRTAGILCLLGATLVILSLATQYSKLGLGQREVLGFTGFADEFYLDAENNLPTYFSSVILLLSSILLGIIASYKTAANDEFKRHWTVLALLFAYLSLDEVSSLHEALDRPLRAAFGATGWLYSAWVLVGLVIVLLSAVWYFRFLIDLERPFNVLIPLAGLVYVAGAIGLELVGGRYAEVHGYGTGGYSLIVHVEETLELGGVVLLLYALMKYMSTFNPEVRVEFGDSRLASGAPSRERSTTQ